MTAVFPKKSDLTGEEVCNNLRIEWKLYQTESISELAYQPVVEPKISSRKQNLYWEVAIHLTGVDHISKELPICDMEKFVLYLQKLNSSDGQPKYPFLVSLFKLVLSISHGNSAPENGFSINTLHGYSLGESTIEALRFVKDAILKHSSILDIPIKRSLLDKVKNSRKKYMTDLEAQRAIEKEEEVKRKELKAKKKNENMRTFWY